MPFGDDPIVIVSSLALYPFQEHTLNIAILFSSGWLDRWDVDQWEPFDGVTLFCYWMYEVHKLICYMGSSFVLFTNEKTI